MSRLNLPFKTIQILLGHSNIRITSEVYTHVMLKKLEALNLLNNLLT